MSKITKTIAALGVVAGLGVAALPLASYAAESNDNPTTVNVTASLQESLTLNVSEDALAVTLTNGGAVQTAATTATVTTNHATGYSLTMAAKGSNANLVSGTNNIPTSATVEQGGASAWGYSLDDGASYKAVPTDATEIASSGTPTDTDGTETKITIGVYADDSQAAGTYNGGFILTATNK